MITERNRNKIEQWIKEMPSHRGRRSLRGCMAIFMNDDVANTFKPVVFGAGTTPITLSGAFTTGISIAADGTTAISVTSAFTGTTGLSFAGTASGDGILVSGACADAIHISGTNTVTGIHISGTQVLGLLFEGTYSTSAIQIGTAGAGAISMAAAADHIIDIYATSPATSGNVDTINVHTTMAGAGATGGRSLFHMYANVALGGWSNALKGFAEYGASGRTTGLGSAICAEVQLSAGTSSGTYTALEAEVVMPTNAVNGTATSFLYCNATGAAVATFDTNGYMLQIGTGITPAAGKFCSLTSQTLKCLIEANTRYMVLSQMEDGLGLGVSGTPMDLTTSTTQRAIDIYTTSASTSGSTSIRPVYMSSTMTGVGGVGGRAEFYMTTNVALGGWSNALKGYVEYGAAGQTTGLGSGICAELALSAGTTVGTYAPLEVEIGVPSGASLGTASSFMYLQVYGADLATFNTSGYLFELGSGISDTAGGLFDLIAVAGFDACLKCRIGGTDYFIPLSADNGFV